MNEKRPPCDPLVYGPAELPPRSQLTNDPTQWEARSRPAPDWEIQEAAERAAER